MLGRFTSRRIRSGLLDARTWLNSIQLTAVRTVHPSRSRSALASFSTRGLSSRTRTVVPLMPFIGVHREVRFEVASYMIHSGRRFRNEGDDVTHDHDMNSAVPPLPPPPPSGPRSGAPQTPSDYYSKPPADSQAAQKSGCRKWAIGCGGAGCLLLVLVL